MQVELTAEYIMEEFNIEEDGKCVVFQELEEMPGKDSHISEVKYIGTPEQCVAYIKSVDKDIISDIRISPYDEFANKAKKMTRH